jgi:hypothetical protein
MEKSIMPSMNLPKLEKAQRYQGLYVIDFGDHTGVGFTADEVAELLESQNAPDGKVYKIYRAYPDGRMELRGVPSQTFQLESGMFFFSQDEEDAREAYQRLIALAVSQPPPCRAKVHLSRWSQEQYVVGLIHPAEFNDEISDWLLDGRYASTGCAEGGIGAAQQYYDRAPEILERHQLYGESVYESRTGETLLSNLKHAVQR